MASNRTRKKRCMFIFSERIANIVQLVSLPLELTGFGLAVIELRSPALADSLETAIDNIADWLMHQFNSEKLIHYLLGGPVFGGILLLIGQFEASVVVFTILTLATVSDCVVTGVFWLVGSILTLLDVFAEGKALGAFGLVLAAIGVLGETYQVISIIVM